MTDNRFAGGGDMSGEELAAAIVAAFLSDPANVARALKVLGERIAALEKVNADRDEAERFEASPEGRRARHRRFLERLKSFPLLPGVRPSPEGGSSP